MKKEVRTRKVAIYSRKSKFTGKGESTENQLKVCREYLHVQFPKISDDDVLEFEDEGFSGAHTKRPQFQKMMDACNNKEIDMIICYRLDRISRKTLDFLEMMESFDKLGISFMSVRDRYDTTSPAGRAMMGMTSIFAQMEREIIAERIRDNMYELAKTGRWLGGNPPTGYSSKPIQKVDDNGKNRTAYKLDIIEEEARKIKTIFQKFLEVNSLSATQTYLLKSVIKSKKGVNYNPTTIKAILKNPVYMIADETAWNYLVEQEIEVFAEKADFDGKHGLIAYRKTKQSTGKSHEYLDMTDWIIAIGKHQGIISGADWVKAQTLLEQNRSKSFHKPKSNVALLSGILLCGDCGSFMRPKLSQRKNDKGEFKYAYLCETKERSRKELCDMNRPDGNALDEAVIDEIKKQSTDPLVFRKKMEQGKKEFNSANADFTDETASLTKEIDRLDTQIKKLVASLAEAEGSVTFEYVDKQIKELDAKKKTAEIRIEEIKCITKQYTYPEEEIEIMTDMLSSFAKACDTMTVEQKRAFLRLFVRNVVYNHDGSIHIYFFGCDDGFGLPNNGELSDNNAENNKASDSKFEAEAIVLQMKYL